MAQTGYTPIQLYRTATASATPVAGNLLYGELAINYNDGVLFYKDSSNAVQVVGRKNPVDTTTAQTLSNKTLTTPVVNGYTEGVVTANTGTAYTIDISVAGLQILTLTGNCTFTFPTATAGKSFTLFLKQDGTGGRTTTFPAAVKWPSSTTPTLTTTASKGDKLVFTADGTYWWGSVAGLNYL